MSSDFVLAALAPDAALGLWASVLAGAATGLGALGVVWIGRPTDRQKELLLSLSAGIMAAAAIFALLVPAIRRSSDAARFVMDSHPAALLTFVLVPLVAGAFMIRLLDVVLGDDYGPDNKPDPAGNLTLVVAALALHNVPEGLAVGASFADSRALGMATAVGIGAQNLPDGFVVAAAVVAMGRRRRWAAALATATGLAEPVFALVGMALAGYGDATVPMALSLAAGAMLSVVATELVPVAISSDERRAALATAAVGFAALTAFVMTVG